MNDVAGIRAVLAEAYFDDPLTRWIFPDPALRLHASAAWWGLFVERYLAGGRVSVIGEHPTAVSLWLMPGEELPPDGLPSIGGLLTALVGADRASVIGDALHPVGDLRPSRPHAYLNFLAVPPAQRGTGLGRAAVEPVLAAASEAALGVHLETTNPANLGFYRHLGFDTAGHVRLTGDGPQLWAMWREP